MVEIFLLLMFIVNVVIGIWVVSSYKEMWHDLHEIESDLYEIQEKKDRIKKDPDFNFVLTEEDAKNYHIQDDLPTRQDVEKFLKKFD